MDLDLPEDEYLSLESTNVVLQILEKIFGHLEGHLLRSIVKNSEECTQSLGDLLSLVRSSLI